MHTAWVMVQINKHFVIGNESAGYWRIWEAWVDHRIVINFQETINFKFLFCNFLFGSLCSFKSSKFKNTVVEIDQSVLLTGGILLYFFQFNVVFGLPTNLFFEHLLVGFQVVHVHIIFLFAFLGNCYGSLWIVGDHNGANGISSLNITCLD